MATRKFGFKTAVERAVIDRQNALCGDCGTDFTKSDDQLHFYHIIPHHVGLKFQPQMVKNNFGLFMASAGNCVLLCDECHPYAHDGGYRNGNVPTGRGFPYAFGGTKGKNWLEWAAEINSYWLQLERFF